MQVVQIDSCRAYESWLSYDLIFEWEDILAKQLHIPIVTAPTVRRTGLLHRFLRHHYVRRAYNYLRNSPVGTFYNRFSRPPYSLVFDLAVNLDPSRTREQNLLPILVDFWKAIDLPQFYAAYQACELVLVSSLEAYTYLREQACPLNLAHFPLSLPDYYQLPATTRYPKQYDILVAGRPNKVLAGYLETYAAKFPHVEVVRRINLEGEFHYMSSTRGLLGKFHTRTEYIDLLRASKIAFYSTPGIDGGEARTGGFNPVTPRYLEMLSAQCLLLGRYPDNEETRFYEVASVCPHIASYEQFEQTLTAYLQLPGPPLATYQAILAQHYTSRRVEQLQAILARY